MTVPTDPTPPFPPPGPPTSPGPARATFRRADRLTHALEFQRVFNARMRKAAGPLAVFSLPNGRGVPRLGLSVGRSFGISVRRSRIKRLLREAFRLSRHEFPRRADGTSYDLILAPRAHAELPLAAYRELLVRLVTQAHTEHERRSTRRETQA